MLIKKRNPGFFNGGIFSSGMFVLVSSFFLLVGLVFDYHLILAKIPFVSAIANRVRFLPVHLVWKQGMSFYSQNTMPLLALMLTALVLSHTLYGLLNSQMNERFLGITRRVYLEHGNSGLQLVRIASVVCVILMVPLSVAGFYNSIMAVHLIVFYILLIMLHLSVVASKDSKLEKILKKIIKRRLFTSNDSFLKEDSTLNQFASEIRETLDHNHLKFMLDITLDCACRDKGLQSVLFYHTLMQAVPRCEMGSCPEEQNRFYKVYFQFLQNSLNQELLISNESAKNKCRLAMLIVLQTVALRQFPSDYFAMIYEYHQTYSSVLLLSALIFYECKSIAATLNEEDEACLLKRFAMSGMLKEYTDLYENTQQLYKYIEAVFGVYNQLWDYDFTSREKGIYRLFLSDLKKLERVSQISELESNVFRRLFILTDRKEHN